MCSIPTTRSLRALSSAEAHVHADADVIVVGAGICGAAAAHFLAGRGRSVIVLDRDGVAEGTSARGEGNVLLCDKLPGPERELTVHGRDLWETLGRRFPQARVARVGSLLLSRDVGDGDAAMLEPALAQGVTAVHEPGDLMVDAPAMARALLDGIDVRTGAEVVAIADRAVDLVGGGRLAAPDIVVCTGPWAGRLTGLPVAPRKGQLVALAAPAGERLVRHKLIEAAYVDAVTSDDAELQVAGVIEQTLDGDEILVGSSRQRVGFDETVDPAVTDAMLARAIQWVPVLAGLTVTRAWAGLRPWLPDHLPAIGPLGLADDGGLWTSTGHEGSGVALGPVSGLLLAQLICGEPPLVDPAPFDPRRF
jgi:glycine/D-amino acid oxidase-like deaminating enzyme